MKRKLLLAIVSIFAILTTSMAQAPQQMNYQAIVRNAAGQPLHAGDSVSMRFIIHESTPTGSVAYQETAICVTNQFGLITHAIGSGGNLATVSWGSGPKYLQVEIDISGGNNFSDMGTSQLVSVPYALFAANSAAGPTGATGTPGPSGSIGATGAQGATGLQGIQGNNGPTGVAGATGLQGLTGPAGATGAAGVQGSTGLNGNPGLPGVTGAVGATGIAGAIGLQGPTGASGNNGTIGLQGATGADGNPGATGITGATGVAGSIGLQGPTGSVGNQGITGAAGITGNDGATGAVGATGLTGAQGPTGPVGTTGSNGVQGPTGAAGATGNNGIQGPTGLQGTTGGNGVQGVTGAIGATGVNGIQGVTGAIGATGFIGAGSQAGNTPYWNGSQWVLNSSNIYNNGGNVGVGVALPGEPLDVNGDINTSLGFTIGGAGASGNYLRGNGTNFVSSPIQAADIPAGSTNYIQNSTSVQSSSNFNVSGNGTVGGNMHVSGNDTVVGNMQVNGLLMLNPSSLGLVGGASGSPLDLTGSISSYVGLLPNGTNQYYKLPLASAYPGAMIFFRNNTTATTAYLVPPSSGSLFAANGNTTYLTYTISGTGGIKTVLAVSDGLNWTILSFNN